MRKHLKNLTTALFSLLLLSLGSPQSALAIDAGPAADTVNVHYRLAADAHITLNIVRPDGWVVRELIVDKPETAGDHDVLWDGRDNNGRILPNGQYLAKVLTHDPIALKYVTSIGNSGTPPWLTSDGTGGWGGNHGNVVAVCSDPTGVYIGWNSTEIPYSLVKRTPDGQRGIWGKKDFTPYAGPSLLAVNGAALYAYTARDDSLYKIDATNGNTIKRLKLNTGWSGNNSEPLVMPPDSVTYNFSEAATTGGVKGLAWGLCAGEGKVYLSDPRNDRIGQYDANSLAHLSDIQVHRPRGLALNAQGNLLVVSDGKVLKVDLVSGKKTDFIAHDLVAPFSIAVKPNGDLLVGDLGSSQQVKEFSSSGQLVRTIGKLGGGSDFQQGKGGGEFDSANLHAPCAVASVNDGSLWVTEDSLPKRVAKFSPDGRLLYQGFGSVNYAAITCLNKSDPSEMFTTMWGLVSGKVDAEKGSWRINRILRPGWNKGGLGDLPISSSPEKCLVRDGKTYLWTGNGMFIVEKDRLRPVMFFDPGIPKKGPLAELAADEFVRVRGWHVEVTIWQDENDDGMVQKEEVHFVPLPGALHGPQYFGNIGVADDFSLLTYGYSWKPTSFTAGGAPLYDRSGIVRSDNFNPSDLTWQGKSPLRDSDGNYYNLVNTGPPNGTTFWSGRVSANYVISYDDQWKPRWTIGQHATDVAAPGEMYYLWRNCGQLADCIVVGDVEGLMHIVHKDGFYVQSVLQDKSKDLTPGPELLRAENFSGSTFEDPATHKKYLAVSSDQASKLFEVTGLESISSQPPQPIVLNRLRSSSRPADYIINRVPALARAGPKSIIPNQQIEWVTASNPILLWNGDQLAGEVRLLYDDDNLYARADILNPELVQRNGKFSLRNGTISLFFDGAGCSSTPWGNGSQQVSLMAKQALEEQVGVYLQSAGDNPDQSLFLPHGQAGSFVPIIRNGYSIVMSIPLKEAFKTAPTAGTRVGFNVAGTQLSDSGLQHVFWAGSPANADGAPSTLGCAVFEKVVTPPSSESIVVQKVTVPPKLNGNPSLWNAPGKATGIYAGSRQVASLKLCYDDTNLYALFEVGHPTGRFKNGASTPEMMMFGGDALCLYFQKPNQIQTAQRIVFGTVKGGRASVVMRPLSDAQRPFSYASPVSTTKFEYVAPAPEILLVLLSEQRRYIAEARIPWKVLGITPAAGSKLGFDAQVIYGDSSGTSPSSMYWWHTRGVDANTVMDAAAMAKLDPTDWGELILK